MDDQHDISGSFADLAFSVLGGILLVLVLLALLISQTAQTGVVTPPGTHLISIEWDEGEDVDIDMWALDPVGKVTSYRKKDQPIINLRRDDLGTTTNDTILIDGRKIINPANREVMDIRQSVPGEYRFNVFLFASREKVTHVTIKGRLIRISPYQEWTIPAFTMELRGQEKALVTFTLGPNGEVKNLSTKLKKFVIRGHGNEHVGP